jgi:hypothetical protein
MGCSVRDGNRGYSIHCRDEFCLWLCVAPDMLVYRTVVESAWFPLVLFREGRVGCSMRAVPVYEQRAAMNGELHNL